MRNVLGVDLGSSWRGMGSAVLSFNETRWISCTPGAIAWPVSICEPAAIADSILAFALSNNICAISLDGPQGWRDADTPGSFVGRECERLTKTPGKTGSFGVAIPGTWLRWIQCSIEVFDRLLRTQHAILANSPEIKYLTAPPDGKFYVLECFPTSTWRQSALKPLPGHHIDLPTIQRFAGDLREAFGLPHNLPTSAREQDEHDNLQAVVAALSAAGLLGGPCQAVPKGLPAILAAARDGIPTHRAEGIIWDAMPIRGMSHAVTNGRSDPIVSNSPPVPVKESTFRASLMPDEHGVERGVRLFAHLVEAANRGEAVGIPYGGFIAHLHGANNFREAVGRNFLAWDAMGAVRVAWSVTDAAGGRKRVARSGSAIDAGMDTFIWNAKRPFDRPNSAWSYSIPYTREQWLSIFPNGTRRLITPDELRACSR